MVYAFSGGLDKPTADLAGIPTVVEPANFDFRKIRFENIAETMRPDVGGIGEAYNSGFRVKAEDLPKVVRIADAAHLVDLDSDGALKYASPRLRDLIERLEPGVHQFEPCVFVDAAGRKIADMFVFFVCQRLDTVDRQHSNFVLYRNLLWLTAKHAQRRAPELLSSEIDVNAEPQMVFNLSQIGGAHLWYDKFIGDRAFVSDGFVQAFYEAGLKGLAKTNEESVA